MYVMLLHKLKNKNVKYHRCLTFAKLGLTNQDREGVGPPLIIKVCVNARRKAAPNISFAQHHPVVSNLTVGLSTHFLLVLFNTIY